MRVEHVRFEFAKNTANLTKRSQAAVRAHIVEIEIAVHIEWRILQTFGQRRVFLAKKTHRMAAPMQPKGHFRGVPRQRVSKTHVCR
jgi:hypothetical protein